ncbi:granulysin isoform X2 [Lutra lutra]|uniref:granulysin isoform X2 n=1 Tax=Lutra lutra TaxID=9657 RepID=UPI001FD44714|nr:granulysin isoform X2 [Lutra lutra]
MRSRTRQGHVVRWPACIKGVWRLCVSSCPTMTVWALLLLASVLLATPGLTFSGLTHEDNDLSMADMYEEEQFFKILAEEDPKGDQIITPCKTCMVIIKWLGRIVRHNHTQALENDNSPQKICVKIRMCRPEIGLGASGALPDPQEKHGIFNNYRQLLPS